MSESEESSPMRRFQKAYCEKCNRHCNFAEPSFLACVLVHLAESVYTIKEIIKNSEQ